VPGISLPVKAHRLLLTPTDALLILMIVIWAGNYSIVKLALREIPPLAFNSLRLTLASLLFLGSLAVAQARRPANRSAPPAPGRARRRWFASARDISGPEWAVLAAVGVLGHFIYQLCFMGGLSRTTVSNSSLILGCSPVVVTFLSAAVGHERVNAWHWAGALLSLGGIYLLAGRGAEISRVTLTGDALCLAAVVCWSVYTVASRPLLRRHSPMTLTGYSMAFGTLLYVPFGLAELQRMDWRAVSAASWASLALSATFALYVAYLIWYTSVQRVGNVRTAVFSNLLPLLSMGIAAVWLGERFTHAALGGAAAIVGGVALTRMGRPGQAGAPAEE
jgi:drug/metabolite transporter (DMT)-like permease